VSAAAEVTPLGVYLSAYLAPFQHWLADENITEILVNQPGEVWTESAGTFGMARHEAPDIDNVLLGRLAAQVARFSHQGISRERAFRSSVRPRRAATTRSRSAGTGSSTCLSRHIAAKAVRAQNALGMSVRRAWMTSTLWARRFAAAQPF
jgi:type IV secretory pathway ATPase VirB11/archaellum biosynthesis ATPase